MCDTGYLPPLVTGVDPVDDPIKFLAINGWFGGDWPEYIELDDPLVQRTVADWQEYAGIRPDGQFKNVSAARAREKRCALPDREKGFVLEDNPDYDPNDPDSEAYHYTEWALPACQQKWTIPEVTVTHENMSFSTLSREETHKAWWQAWQHWMAIPAALPRVKFVPWNGPKSANAWHRAILIDGRSSVLAWQVLPGCNAGTSRTCEGRYDTGERWGATFFSGVVVHEGGHFWGEHHESDPSAVMYPYARQNIVTPQPVDIANMQRRYGKATPTPGPDPGPLPPSTLESRVSFLEMQMALVLELLKSR